MALITVPSFLKTHMETADLRLERTDFMMRSAFTRTRQVLAFHSGHMWVCTAGVPNLEEPKSGQMRAFLASMRGRANTAQFPVPGYRGPSNGYAGAAGRVNGAGQSGYSINTDGWAINTTVLPSGSYFTINGELKLVIGDVTTNGTGAATITFEPALRYTPADNTQLVINDPYCIMSMSNSDGAGWGIRAPGFQNNQLAFEEAVNVS